MPLPGLAFGGSRSPEEDLPMSSDEIVIDVQNLSKRYEIYATPRDRLKQLVLPTLLNIFSHLGLRSRATIEHPPQYFREFWALHDVSFQVRRGETVGIVGLNGSGKSTLLQLICSTLTPSSGNVEVKGRVAALLELGSGFNPDYTGRENVFLNGQILGLSREEIQDRFQAIETFADIGDFIDRPVKTYSSGMAVRLAFAVAINVEPEILVIDEALAVGDVGFQVRCFKKIGELQKNGTTLIFVSHSPSSITQLCGRAIVLHQGSLLLDCEPYEAIRTYTALCNADSVDYEQITSRITQPQKSSEGKEADIAISDIDESICCEQDMPKVSDAYFDESLSKAVLPHLTGEMGIMINEVRITSEDGSAINVIPQGLSAILNFKVKFYRPVGSCRLAWTLRSIQGVILGGGATHSAGDGCSYSDEEIEVLSRFNNYFTPGEYLIDIYVRGGGSADNAFLCADNDAIIFRSILNTKMWRNGMVNCLAEDGFVVRHGDGNIEIFK